MKAFICFMKEILKDTDGLPSSKRLVTLFCTLLIGIGFIGNLFWDFNIDQFIFDGVMYIVIAGLGISGAEKFASKTNTT